MREKTNKENANEHLTVFVNTKKEETRATHKTSENDQNDHSKNWCALVFLFPVLSWLIGIPWLMIFFDVFLTSHFAVWRCCLFSALADRQEEFSATSEPSLTSKFMGKHQMIALNRFTGESSCEASELGVALSQQYEVNDIKSICPVCLIW